MDDGTNYLPILFPFLFLIGHGLELAYKAVLIVDGATEKDLMRIGHDLTECRRRVHTNRPGLLKKLEKPGTEEMVGMIDPYYKAKALEYHKTGLYSALPAAPSQIIVIMIGTVKNIEKWVRSRVRQKMRDAEDGT